MREREEKATEALEEGMPSRCPLGDTGHCPKGSVAGHPLSSPFLRLFPPPLDSRSSSDGGSAQSPSPKQKADVSPEAPKMDLLTVPVVDTEMEARPMTLEEMEDVGKHYRDRKRQNKVPPPAGGTGPGERAGWAHLPTCPSLWPGELWGSQLPYLLAPSSVCMNNTCLPRFLIR